MNSAFFLVTSGRSSTYKYHVCIYIYIISYIYIIIYIYILYIIRRPDPNLWGLSPCLYRFFNLTCTNPIEISIKYPKYQLNMQPSGPQPHQPLKRHGTTYASASACLISRVRGPFSSQWDARQAESRSSWKWIEVQDVNLGFVGKNPGIWRFLVRFYGDSTPVVRCFGDLGENLGFLDFFSGIFFWGQSCDF